jgi:diguanylate cyclase (GGDEF)-like protein
MDQQPKSGMKPGFNLSERIEEATSGINPLDLPVQAEAARRLGVNINYDPLTELLNKKAYVEMFETAVAELADGERIYAFMADTDNFKPVNDHLGHEAGDKLLGIIGEVFREVFQRDTDFVAHGSRTDDNIENISRLSGDEFAAFSRPSPNIKDDNRESSAEEEARTQKQRVNMLLHSKLESTEFEPFDVSVSIGAVEVRKGDAPAVALAKADLAMFQDKYQGKIESVSESDREFLRKVIPELDRIGTRVEQWLREAAKLGVEGS